MEKISEKIDFDFPLPLANGGGITINDIVKDIQQYSNDGFFPVDVFPKQIQQIIYETNKCLDFPIDFIGASILSAISIVTGNTYKVKVKNTWNESALIYIALVGKAGTNKTHPLKFALNPIHDKDKNTYKVYEIKNKEYEQFQKLPANEKKERYNDEPIKPIIEKYIVSDFTPESLIQVHKFNKRGIGVYVDEFASWIKNFNKYRNGADEQFWLSSFSNTPIVVDRKTSDSIRIENPFITVVGTIQDNILIDISKGDRSNNGFMDRILFAMPENLYKEHWNEIEPDQKITDNWNLIINKILNIPINLDEYINPISIVLKLDPQAKNIHKNWYDRNVDLINNTDNSAIRSIFSKLDIYVFRLALIIEMSKFACNESELNNISVDSVNGAIKLVEYFRKTALKVHSIIHNENDIKLSLDKVELLKALPNEFTTGEGLIIAQSLNIPERTYKDFISKNIDILFINLKHGEYKKIK